MIKVGVADYGMHVWFGGMYDYEKRMADLKKIGYDGIERLSVEDADDVMRKLVCLAKLQMDFATVENKNIERMLKWTAALGKKYIWANKSIYIANDFDAYCRNTEYLAQACREYGIRAAVHNHLGSLVESQDELEEFLRRCPDAGLLLDTGHLGVAGGDVLEIADKYYDRIVAVHLKDWVSTDPSAPEWYRRGYFTGLGHGNMPIDNEGVVKLLKKRGYDGWIFIEEDTHKRDPFEDLAECSETIRSWLA